MLNMDEEEIVVTSFVPVSDEKLEQILKDFNED
jgi:hypothetical protein